MVQQMRTCFSEVATSSCTGFRNDSCA